MWPSDQYHRPSFPRTYYGQQQYGASSSGSYAGLPPYPLPDPASSQMYGPANGNRDIDLLLIGKTGHGKSSTGNSILGRSAFGESDGADSFTADIGAGWARRLGRKVKVVDGPGVGDTRVGKGTAAQMVVNSMTKAMSFCSQGFHALLLVLKYGNRFTEEELNVVRFLKSLFGQQFVRNHCILVFSHGENFVMENKRRQSSMSFEDWCNKQTGHLQDLFCECNYKAVLFHNLDDEQTMPQLKALFQIVDGMGGVRYTNDMFDKIAKEREALIVRNNALALRDGIQSRIDLLLGGLENLRQILRSAASSSVPPDSTLFDQEVENLRQDARELVAEIHQSDRGTGVLTHIVKLVQDIEGNIETYVKEMQSVQTKVQEDIAMTKMEKQMEDCWRRLKDEQNREKRSWTSILSGVAKSAAGFLVYAPLGVAVSISEISRIYF